MAKVFTITEGLENMGALKTGGQGSVYKGRRTGPILTAVKLLPTPIHSESPDDKHFSDFMNEVAKLKKVNEQPNPNVVKILSSGITETGNLPFIEMEFIEGPDLEELLAPPRDPVFPVKEVIKVAEHLSNALAHCHRVEIRHGDVKSNNVKFNIHTGNYVLLDFGLAVMSDEQRRTSLRHAGAVEFMAPEQNEGVLLYQSDIYGFGIILYELLAGRVPFPLKDKSELARNLVMVAHMESQPPDLLNLRRERLPESWSAARRARELQVPDWVVRMIYKCLAKGPNERFANGAELHDFILQHSIGFMPAESAASPQLLHLQQESDRLKGEREQLQQLLAQYQNAASGYEEKLNRLRAELQEKDREVARLYRERDEQRRTPPPYTPAAPPARKGVPGYVYLIILLAAGLGIYVFYLINNRSEEEPDPRQTAAQEAPKKRSVIGQYKVIASRAYFHNEPDESTRRSAYLTPSGDVVNAMEEQNNFIYTEFTNSRGQTSKGWVRKQDLMTVEEWTRRSEETKPDVRLTQVDINAQLQEARRLMEASDLPAALNIYNYLAEEEVPEAMYYAGNFALQQKNEGIGCEKGYAWVKKASDRGYTPAKRTLGFLYLFAENKQVLDLND
ncbi:MAG TPA: serine/threonine-protein kinase, partial [Chitinophagaceae bacterium]|nr:serine/threonine-protein kinase [Chitinophagaceae bacterium]